MIKEEETNKQSLLHEGWEKFQMNLVHQEAFFFLRISRKSIQLYSEAKNQLTQARLVFSIVVHGWYTLSKSSPSSGELVMFVLYNTRVIFTISTF